MQKQPVCFVPIVSGGKMLCPCPRQACRWQIYVTYGFDNKNEFKKEKRLVNQSDDGCEMIDIVIVISIFIDHKQIVNVVSKFEYFVFYILLQW